MTLYHLELPRFPLNEAYARSPQDIVDCVLALHQWRELFRDFGEGLRMELSDPSLLDRITPVERGVLLFDLVPYSCRPSDFPGSWAEFPLAADFEARVRLDSLFLFKHFQGELPQESRGPLSRIVTNPTGSMYWSSFVPLDVVMKLKQYDVSEFEERAREYHATLERDIAITRQRTEGFMPLQVTEVQN